MPRGAVFEATPIGPFDHWPTGSGFEHFYGFIGGETNQYFPGLFEGTAPVEPEKATRTSSGPRIQICPTPTATIPKPRTVRVRRPLPERTSKTSDARASATRRPSCDALTVG
jgi:hypothetical protein